MIEIKDVRAGYGEEDILHGISFEVQDGESLCIIGPNGCGKTTLLRALAGILPFRGEITLDGVKLKKMKRKTLARKIVMLSQITHVYFNYTVYDTVMMGRYAHKRDGFFVNTSEQDKLIVNQVLETVGALEIKDREIDTLSGGQLQRVFLAKVLAQDPEIILLDEPTNHLDLSYQIELIRFLKDWSKQSNKSIIGVLHDLNLAMLLSDNILLMEGGTVKAYGKSSEVLSSDVLENAYKMDVAEFMLETLKKWEQISKLRTVCV